jgi:hypothetical protein
MYMIVPVLSLIAGAYWLIRGFDYGFWVRKGPGPGFLPVIAGAVVVVCAIVIIIANIRDKNHLHFTRKVFVPVLAMLGLGLGCYVIGMIMSIALFLVLWLKIAEKRSTVETLLISVITTATLYGIFVFWLSVPMPKGFLGIL